MPPPLALVAALGGFSGLFPKTFWESPPPPVYRRATTDRTAPEADPRLPLPQLLLFALQHVLVMAAAPITSVFLVAKALDLPAELTVNIISATFLLCGLGAILQSLGTAEKAAEIEPFKTAANAVRRTTAKAA